LQNLGVLILLSFHRLLIIVKEVLVMRPS